MKKNNSYIICPSCGGKFDASMSKCPYCENTNLEGAEIEYMQALNDIEQNVKNMPEKEFSNSFSIWMRQIKKVIFTMLITILILFISYLVITHIDNTNKNKLKQEVINEINRE